MKPNLIYYKRLLEFNLPKRQSAFLWGPRQAGKSTYLEVHFPNAVRYDFLKSELCLKYSKSPHLFREEILALTPRELKEPVVVDEVQKVPSLLDEIHWLIENTKAYFILCGSSARKLKKDGVNLLGGRAWKFEFYPLAYPEVPNFNLLKALNTGLIPSHYLSVNPRRSLKSYIQDYLTQEIKAEGLVRNLPAFARFLDALAFSNGELTNFTNIGRECGIDAKTVKAYYEILVDTLMGDFIYPYAKHVKRSIISAIPKFYLFDVGVAGFLERRHIDVLQGSDAGRAFEHFILMELRAYRGINDLDFNITFWRTKQKLEVDFILGQGEVAVEVKISRSVKKQDIKGLYAFVEEHAPKQAIVVSLDPRARKIKMEHGQEILILPYEQFLKKLWGKKIIK